MDTEARFAAPLCQSVGATVEGVDTAAMRADFVIVTNNGPNRSGSKIEIMTSRKGKGLSLENYAKNPICYFEHGFRGWPLNLPIGRADDPSSGELSVKLRKEKATGSVYFSKEDAAQAIFRLYEEKVLRAASIMYEPIKAVMEQVNPEDPEDNRRMLHVYEADLREFGPVGIGADPDAVRQAMDRPYVLKVDGLRQALGAGIEDAELLKPLMAQLGSMREELAAMRAEHVASVGEMHELLTQRMKKEEEAKLLREAAESALAYKSTIAGIAEGIRASIADIRTRIPPQRRQ
jgi:hypothetical protein